MIRKKNIAKKCIHKTFKKENELSDLGGRIDKNVFCDNKQIEVPLQDQQVLMEEPL